MKTIFTLIVTYFLVASCSIVNKSSSDSTKHKAKLRYPTLTSETEQFDISIFDTRRDEVTVNGLDTVYHYYDTQSYGENDSKRNEFKSFYKKDDGSIFGYDYSVNPIIGIYKEFFSNGQIKVKGVFCWFGFKTGNWFYYDNKGKITHTIDYDSDYKFNTSNIISFCKKNKIPLEKVTSGPRTSIRKVKLSDGRSIWVISYPRQDIFYYINLQIDATNGKIITTGKSPWPREE